MEFVAQPPPGAVLHRTATRDMCLLLCLRMSATPLPPRYGPDLVPGDGFRDRNIVLKAVDTLAVDEEHTLVAFGVVEHIGREGGGLEGGAA